MRNGLLVLSAMLLFSFTALSNEHWKEKTENADYIHRAIKQLTDVMVHDIYSPPVASRTYAYLSIAGYEALAAGDPNYQSLAGQLHGLKTLPKPVAGKEYSYTIAAVQAILTVGKAMVISENDVNTFYEIITKEFQEFRNTCRNL